ncbi:MAG: hypothetical protein PHC83_04115 [Bacteroidales bacterium]|nr:hypothetical protein [Bacteroidales bacterium]
MNIDKSKRGKSVFFSILLLFLFVILIDLKFDSSKTHLIVIFILAVLFVIFMISERIFVRIEIDKNTCFFYYYRFFKKHMIEKNINDISIELKKRYTSKGGKTMTLKISDITKNNKKYLFKVDSFLLSNDDIIDIYNYYNCIKNKNNITLG